MVLVDRDVFRHPRIRAARHRRRHARRPRSHQRRRQHRDPSRHVRRAKSRARVHRQSARRSGRRHEERERRVHPRLERHARAERSQRRLHLAVARTSRSKEATRSRCAFRSAACDIRGAAEQRWGLQIDRRVQHNGYEETWTPAKRASASFIGQAGRTRWTERNAPRRDRRAQSRAHEYRERHAVLRRDASATGRYASNPQIGGNVRWAVGSNFVLNGTVKPDFSQVEADATQIAADERFALFYAERRPFFVEALDQFNVPNTLVYTRTIVRPDGARKLTGKLGARRRRRDVGGGSGRNELQQRASARRHRSPAAELRRPVARRTCCTATGSANGRTNRVFGGDTHIVFGRNYSCSSRPSRA